MKKQEKNPNEIRTVWDDIRQQHQKMGNMPLKKRLAYFWYYYKIHTIVIICVLIFGISLISNIVNAKPYSFYGIMMNSQSLSEEEMEAGFIDYADLDSDSSVCFIDTATTMDYQTASEYDMATAQRIMALIQTRDLDAVVFDSEAFSHYAISETFADLRNVFTPQQLTKYEKYIYYIDYAEIQKADEDPFYQNQASSAISDAADLQMEDILAEADSHRHPENMKEPIPVGVFVDESPFAVHSKAYSPFVPVYGISVTSKRMDTAIKYLDFLWDSDTDFSKMYAPIEY